MHVLVLTLRPKSAQAWQIQRFRLQKILVLIYLSSLSFFLKGKDKQHFLFPFLLPETKLANSCDLSGHFSRQLCITFTKTD